MKQKKWTICLLLAVVCLAVCIALAACNTTHSHTFSEQWTSNEIYHWHAATCEHTNEISNAEPHSFDNGICAVCKYTQGATNPPASNKQVYDMSGISFDDATVTYDGQSHSIEIGGALPDGVTVAYLGNEHVNAGTYVVVAKFFGDTDNYEPIPDQTAILTITKATVENFTFDDATVTYDGQSHSLRVGYLPEGVTVSYENNGQINAGVYTITAKFTVDGNHEEIEDKTATLTIQKRELTIRMVSKTEIKYDGNSHKEDVAFQFQNLAYGDSVDTSVVYSGDMIEAGEYTVTAIIADNPNYTFTQVNTFKVTITRATHKVTFRQDGQPDQVVYVLDLAGLSESDFPTLAEVVGYTFAWGNVDLSCVTSDVTVNAIKTLVPYTITYVLDDGTNSNYNPTQYNVETQLTLAKATKDNYTFMGWYTDEQLTQAIETITRGSYGNLTLYAKWHYGTEGLVYSLSGSEYSITDYKGSSQDVVIPSSWNDLPVTSIGAYAFRWNSIQSIIFEDDSQLKTIEDYAFDNCSGLTGITIPSSVTYIGNYAFRDCVSLTGITISSSVTYIGSGAFRGCTSLSTVYWNATNCTSAGSSAWPIFRGCTSLKTVEIGANVQTIPSYAFSDCSGMTSITIPEGVTTIGDYAFSDCSGMTSITISSSVTYIGSGAFRYCYRLREVWNDSALRITVGSVANGYVAYYAVNVFVNHEESRLVEVNGFVFSANDDGEFLLEYKGNNTNLELPNSSPGGNPYGIYKYAFYGCSSLTSIVMPEGVTTIGDYAFSDCSGMTSITMPSSVTSIGYYAFDKCSSLTSITIPKSVTSIDENAFGDCTSLSTVYWNAINCTSGGSSAWSIFSGSTRLKTVEIGANVQTIPSYAFYDCSKLTSITIPEGVTTIGEGAFYRCSGLISVTIPESVTSIGRSAFRDCSNLQTVYYGGTEEQWQQINVNSSYNDDLTGATRYYYSAEEPQLNADGTDYDGNYWHWVDDTPTIWKKEG